MRVLRRFGLATAVMLLLSLARAEASEEALVERLDTLERSPFAHAAEGSLSQARGALARVATLKEQQQPAAAKRAYRIAVAATELASRQVARAQEQNDRVAASRRLAQIRDRLTRATAALQRLRERGLDPSEAVMPGADEEVDDPE